MDFHCRVKVEVTLAPPSLHCLYFIYMRKYNTWKEKLQHILNWLDPDKAINWDNFLLHCNLTLLLNKFANTSYLEIIYWLISTYFFWKRDFWMGFNLFNSEDSLHCQFCQEPWFCNETAYFYLPFFSSNRHTSFSFSKSKILFAVNNSSGLFFVLINNSVNALFLVFNVS